MWIIFGIGAVLTAILNLIWWVMSKNTEIFRFLSLSLTGLTLCAKYSKVNEWVIVEDWTALMDVVPTMSSALWILIVVSILVNGVTLIKRK